MYYVQYYDKRGNDYVEACGDRSILILDGRNNLETMCKDAEDHNGFEDLIMLHIGYLKAIRLLILRQ